MKIVLASIVALLVVTAEARSNFHSRSNTECPSANDVVFVLDESGSIYPPDFIKQLEFVKNFINRFDTSFNMTHIGVMTFSTKEKIRFHLDRSHDKEEMKGLVGAITQSFGQTYTNLALDSMRSDMFSPSHARSWAPHTAIVITDGNPDYIDRTVTAANAAHADGITVVAIGVGSVKESVLASIASSPDLIIAIKEYNQLESQLISLVQKTCQVVTTTTTTTTTTTPSTTTLPLMVSGCRGNTALDIAFALPDSMGVVDTEYSLEFVEGMVEDFELGPSQSQVALTPRYCVEGRGIGLTEYDSSSGFSSAMYTRRRITQSSTAIHLQTIIEETFSTASGARQEATKVAIIVVEDPLDDAVKDLVDAAKEQGIHLVVIGVGNNVEYSDLESMASSPDNVYHVSSYSELEGIHADILTRMCAIGAGIPEATI